MSEIKKNVEIIKAAKCGELLDVYENIRKEVNPSMLKKAVLALYALNEIHNENAIEEAKALIIALR